MQYVNITEFKANFSTYLQTVENEDIVLTRYGTPLVIIRRFTQGLSADDHKVEQDNSDSQMLQSEGRFDGLNLEEYRRRIKPSQFKLLMDYVGVEDASPDFDPTQPFYPEDV